MKPPSPFPPLGQDVLDALVQLERATTLRGVERAYDTVRAASIQRSFSRLLIALLVATVCAMAAEIAYGPGGIAPNSVFLLFAIIPTPLLTPAIELLMRGPRPAAEERRMRNALNVANVLKRAEKTT